MPELSDKSGYLMKIEESKGGIAVFHFESDEQPLPTDFSALGGMIEAPDSYYEFVEIGNLIEITKFIRNKTYSLDPYSVHNN